MNEREKAEALSRSLDAILSGEEPSAVCADDELEALSELGRSLCDVAFEPRPAHRAAVERLLQERRADIRQAVTAKGKDRTSVRAGGSIFDRLPRWFVPAAASGLALAFLCAFLALVGGGFALWSLRDKGTEPVLSYLAEATATAVEPQSTAAIAAVTATPVQAQRTATVPAPTETPVEPVQEPDETVSAPVSTPSDAGIVRPAALRGIRGLVEIQGDDGRWLGAGEGQEVRVGQRVRTGALSAAQIGFSDGSTVSIGPGAELSVDLLDLGTEDARIVELTQWIGESDHDVAPANGENARYVVHTPTGTGEAKGTLFHVWVTPALIAHFSVDEGAVAVTHLNVTVIVVAGQLTTIHVDQPPSVPWFRVTGEGQVTQAGAVWQIAGQTFTTHEGTITVGSPQVGDWVFVDGHLLLDGTRVADRIVLLHRSPVNRFSITGEVEANDQNPWIVAGQEIAVHDETNIDEGIEVEDLVHVEGVVEDGVLLAETIRLIAQEPGLTFQFVGVVQAMTDDDWTVSEVTVAVDAETIGYDDPQVGDVVLVRGQVQEDETWLARTIERLAVPETKFEFRGTVESLSPWKVSDITFETRLWTEIDEGIGVGAQVKVEGHILADGTWVADEIELVDEGEELSFEFVGIVDQMDPSWIVSGISITVNADTEIVGEVIVGSLVKVEGRIDDGDEWLATEIKLLSEVRLGAGCVRIVAVVLDVGPGSILLPNGTHVEIGEGTLVEGELAAGAVVEMWVCVDNDGQVMVVSIVVIYWLDPGDIVIPTPTPVPTAAPPEEEGTVIICHKPGTPAQKTMTVPTSALAGHLGHGDTFGACPKK